MSANTVVADGSIVILSILNPNCSDVITTFSEPVTWITGKEPRSNKLNFSQTCETSYASYNNVFCQTNGIQSEKTHK
jgi:hypothetical protein